MAEVVGAGVGAIIDMGAYEFPGGLPGADLDINGDVDLADFGVFASCFNGPNRPPMCE
ncbi:MAG: hypothetical protein JXA69_03470 [Phycisphaerae bacterium]|nr:hypothetical protein [Phycisphaerae bacterium]